MYKVIRYSGRYRYGVPEMRVLYEGNDGEKAVKIYNKIQKEMRQGRVEYWKGSSLLAFREEPTLRSRW